ncbi:protein LTO1 homolog [Antedon mediterranea]|uniref:protein LTO1 homolog n=1 Tax=Antedon mediterranea TaxID=105859 RepID=UPI003AF44D7D
MTESEDRITDDIDRADLFDSIICAEERCEKNGFLVGKKEGKDRGLKNGFQKGIGFGKQVGEEIGFYHGFVLTWKNILEKKDERNTRKMKAFASLLGMLEDFDLSNPSVDDYMVKLTQIRSKFKQVSSLLGVQLQHDDEDTERSNPQPLFSF